jgi:hypothetical protein
MWWPHILTQHSGDIRHYSLYRAVLQYYIFSALSAIKCLAVSHTCSPSLGMACRLKHREHESVRSLYSLAVTLHH